MTEQLGLAMTAKQWREWKDAIRALYEMGCTCGVITADDGKRWNVAQQIAPQIVAALEDLLPPD